MRDSIKQALLSALQSLDIDTNDVLVEHPADLQNGDYASSAALQYAKQARMNPSELAEKIVAALGSVDGGVAKIEIAGPGFINFHLTPEAIAMHIKKARTEDMWGANAALRGKKIMVEYTDPNPFKEFHIGHLMSNAIGESISRLLQFSGAEVKRANYQGDVGPHVAKCIWGLQKLELDPASAVSLGKAYAAGAKAYEEDTDAKAEIDAINAQVYDHSNAAIDQLYAQGREASLKHFEIIYQKLGTQFDYYFFESVTAPKGIALVNQHRDLFKESEGAIVYEGEKAGLNTRVFITSKGLPTYETKDLGLAELKAETWPFDESITITAHEQAGYFAVVLAAMREIMPEIAAKLTHISHGMMRFAEGKMSSRTGNVVTGESLLNELVEQANTRAAESRADDKAKLAEQVAVAAVKYQVLKQVSGKDIIFDRERALSLEGDSGPYLQYAHARTHQIIEKAGENRSGASVIPEKAQELARLLVRFPEIVEYASDLREPHLVTTYLITVASAFNSWYAQEQILDGTSAQADKVALTDAVRKTLKNGLWILGIRAPEKM
jgi:arginyl-tRNA synthetase